jgi:subtilisin family serine protease
MIANCDSEVNANRAEHSGYTAVTSRALLEKDAVRGEDAQAFRASELSLEEPIPDPPPLEEVSGDVLVNVFIETNDLADESAIQKTIESAATADPEDAEKKKVGVPSRRGNIATATVRLSQLQDLINLPGVTFVEAGQALATPTPIVSSEVNVHPSMSPRAVGNPEEHKNGQGVLIGIIDVQGFDFAHEDFLKDGGTRFLRIWDQGGEHRPSPHERSKGDQSTLFANQFDYGSEIRQEDMNTAIRMSEQIGAPPQELEPQSQMSPGSHGTHVASIAAGNHGVAPEADIAAVLISLPADDNERRRSFYDSTRIAHAVDYLFALGQELEKKVSINISLGTNGHAHDASSAVSRWLDSALAMPGRSICVAAGNAGQQESGFQGDLGWVMGRIHTSGRVSARGLASDIDWEVVGNGRADLSENELEIWYAPQDQFEVSIKPPGMDWIGPIKPLEYLENYPLRDTQGELLCVLSLYNELYHPANGSNYISIYLAPFLKEPIAGIRSGTWMVRLHGLDVRNGRYHGWIERDDPRRIGRLGDREAWRFPSFFSERSNVDNSSVSSLACGQRIISVGNLDEKHERINITSSQGPTRDDRFKPDVCAPGTDIVAAYGFGDESQRWVKMTGTSMASPYVTGLAALMLAIQPRLTAAQIEGIIHRTSHPLPGADFNWLNDAGFGRINPEMCLTEAKVAYQRTAYQPVVK